MGYPANTISLYKCMMNAQRNGSFTEHHLLDFMQFFWYNGDYNEYYTNYYIPKRSRGA